MVCSTDFNAMILPLSNALSEASWTAWPGDASFRCVNGRSPHYLSVAGKRAPTLLPRQVHIVAVVFTAFCGSGRNLFVDIGWR